MRARSVSSAAGPARSKKRLTSNHHRSRYARNTGSFSAPATHPLGLTPRRDEIARPRVLEQVHRDGAPLSAPASAYREDPGSVETHAEAREPGHHGVEDAVEGAGRDIVALRHAGQT
jgi:hypothetical protein